MYGILKYPPMFDQFSLTIVKADQALLEELIWCHFRPWNDIKSSQASVG